MKRLFQILAMLLIGLLIAGPALTASACTLDNMAMGASCPMGMAGMGAADCPMSHNLATTYCAQDCCNRALPQAVPIQGFHIKPKLLAISPDLAHLTALPAVETDFTPELVSFPVVTSPPRYIQLRVFRI